MCKQVFVNKCLSTDVCKQGRPQSVGTYRESPKIGLPGLIIKECFQQKHDFRIAHLISIHGDFINIHGRWG